MIAKLLILLEEYIISNCNKEIFIKLFKDTLFVLWNGQRSGVGGGGGGVDRCPRQCPGVVNESRGMTDTPKPAASPSSSHPTAAPAGPTYITGLSPFRHNFYTFPTPLSWTPAAALLSGETNDRRYA